MEIKIFSRSLDYIKIRITLELHRYIKIRIFSNLAFGFLIMRWRNFKFARCTYLPSIEFYWNLSFSKNSWPRVRKGQGRNRV